MNPLSEPSFLRPLKEMPKKMIMRGIASVKIIFSMLEIAN